MSLASHTILLIEDDASDAALLDRAFKGAKVVRPLQVVSTGEAGITYLDGRGKFADRDQFPLPDLIFLDLKLPGLSGFEVLTWIRQQSRFDKVRVVVLTGSKKSLDVYRAYELGANSYLVKPVNRDDLSGLAKNLQLPWLSLLGELTVRRTTALASVSPSGAE